MRAAACCGLVLLLALAWCWVLLPACCLLHDADWCWWCQRVLLMLRCCCSLLFHPLGASYRSLLLLSADYCYLRLLLLFVVVMMLPPALDWRGLLLAAAWCCCYLAVARCWVLLPAFCCLLHDAHWRG